MARKHTSRLDLLDPCLQVARNCVVRMVGVQVEPVEVAVGESLNGPEGILPDDLHVWQASQRVTDHRVFLFKVLIVRRIGGVMRPFASPKGQSSRASSGWCGEYCGQTRLDPRRSPRRSPHGRKLRIICSRLENVMIEAPFFSASARRLGPLLPGGTNGGPGCGKRPLKNSWYSGPRWSGCQSRDRSCAARLHPS